jgi:hypothetical protein
MGAAQQRGLTLAWLKDELDYNPDTGDLTRKRATWRTEKGGVVGSYAFGYKQVGLGGRNYRAHVLAWFLYHGVWPDKELDHINGVRDDNRIANLRLATPRQQVINRKNQANNTSGCTGVHWDKSQRKWTAQIRLPGKHNKFLGRFDTKEEAIAARKTAEDEYGFTPWTRKENV